MGIQLNGTSGTDVISAVDGSLTVEGLTISGDFNIADKIIHSGDTNTAIRFPAADTVSVETGGTERIRITSAGKLGIGTDNPAEELHLQGNTAVVALVESVGANDSRVRIKAPSDRISYLEFADDDADAGEIRYDHTNNYMALHVNSNQERLRIGSSGQIGLGGANYGTSGQVLTSNGSSSAPTWQTVSGGGSDVGITTALTGTFNASSGAADINSYTYHNDDKVVEYTVYVKNGSDFQTSKVLAMRDGTTIHSTQFAVMFSSSLLVQFDATISSGNINLRATPESGVTGNTTYRIKREVM